MSLGWTDLSFVLKYLIFDEEKLPRSFSGALIQIWVKLTLYRFSSFEAVYESFLLAFSKLEAIFV